MSGDPRYRPSGRRPPRPPPRSGRPRYSRSRDAPRAPRGRYYQDDYSDDDYYPEDDYYQEDYPRARRPRRGHDALRGGYDRPSIEVLIHEQRRAERTREVSRETIEFERQITARRAAARELEREASPPRRSSTKKAIRSKTVPEDDSDNSEFFVPQARRKNTQNRADEPDNSRRGRGAKTQRQLDKSRRLESSDEEAPLPRRRSPRRRRPDDSNRRPFHATHRGRDTDSDADAGGPFPRLPPGALPDLTRSEMTAPRSRLHNDITPGHSFAARAAPSEGRSRIIDVRNRPVPKHSSHAELKRCLAMKFEKDAPRTIPARFGSNWGSRDDMVFPQRYGATEACHAGLCKYLFFRNGRCPKGDDCLYRHTWPTEDMMVYLLSNPDEKAVRAARGFLTESMWSIWHHCSKGLDLTREEPGPPGQARPPTIRGRQEQSHQRHGILANDSDDAILGSLTSLTMADQLDGRTPNARGDSSRNSRGTVRSSGRKPDSPDQGQVAKGIFGALQIVGLAAEPADQTVINRNSRDGFRPPRRAYLGPLGLKSSVHAQPGVTLPGRRYDPMSLMHFQSEFDDS
ncbi:Nn.00g100130.m01.CDS01 [Neocucurbitaria sp. VM-36]